MTDSTISLGLIGAGIMGERMLRAALDQPATALRVSGIWDPSTDAMERIAAALPAVPRQPDAAALIRPREIVESVMGGSLVGRPGCGGRDRGDDAIPPSRWLAGQS